MIAVIGGAGLVGSHVVDELLRRGTSPGEIVVVDDLSRGRPENLPASVEPIVADLTSAESLRVVREADVVYLTAARWLLEVEQHPEEAGRVNTLAPHVLACAMKPGARLIFSSSASVYGQFRGRPFGETDPVDPSHLYAATKVAAENLLASHAGRIFVTCLRYANVYGPRMDNRGAYMGVLSHWLNAALKGEPIKVVDEPRAYDFVRVEDVASINVDAATKPPGIYNVCTGQATTLADLAEMVSDATGAPVEFVKATGPRPPVTVRVMDDTLMSNVFGGFDGALPCCITLHQVADLWEWWQREHRVRR